MTQDGIFRILTLVLLMAGFGISGYFRSKADREGGRLNQSNKTVLIALRLLGLAVIWPLIAYLINPAWVAWARWPVPLWLRWAAVGVAFAAVPAIYWLFSSIGNNISPTHATRQDHQLITSGPYQWIRHPLYTFGFTFFLAISVATSLWWVTMGLLIPMAVLFWRTPQEEQNLIAEFGDEYREYMKQTGRYFPRLRSG
ncbi:MAG: isoprenylcysteine carboxylmethyltransferase family protein [Anaerolineales bacterium]|nr:isoprenylcysteine carboxylmethyltransferase family protein [Anaerolineales bacterium]